MTTSAECELATGHRLPGSICMRVSTRGGGEPDDFDIRPVAVRR